MSNTDTTSIIVIVFLMIMLIILSVAYVVREDPECPICQEHYEEPVKQVTMCPKQEGCNASTCFAVITQRRNELIEFNKQIQTLR